MRRLGGHLGGQVSALVDAQLPAAQAERLWAHVAGCAACGDQVDRETWVKDRLARMAPTEPPAALGDELSRDLVERLGSWPAPGRPAQDQDAVLSAWVTVGELERRHRLRRAGLVVVGAGSVSAAVLGLGALTGATDGSGPPPTGTTISDAATRTPTPVPSGVPILAPSSPGGTAQVEPVGRSVTLRPLP